MMSTVQPFLLALAAAVAIRQSKSSSITTISAPTSSTSSCSSSASINIIANSNNNDNNDVVVEHPHQGLELAALRQELALVKQKLAAAQLELISTTTNTSTSSASASDSTQSATKRKRQEKSAKKRSADTSKRLVAVFPLPAHHEIDLGRQIEFLEYARLILENMQQLKQQQISSSSLLSSSSTIASLVHCDPLLVETTLAALTRVHVFARQELVRVIQAMAPASITITTTTSTTTTAPSSSSPFAASTASILISEHTVASTIRSIETVLIKFQNMHQSGHLALVTETSSTSAGLNHTTTPSSRQLHAMMLDTLTTIASCIRIVYDRVEQQLMTTMVETGNGKSNGSGERKWWMGSAPETSNASSRANTADSNGNIHGSDLLISNAASEPSPSLLTNNTSTVSLIPPSFLFHPTSAKALSQSLCILFCKLAATNIHILGEAIEMLISKIKEPATAATIATTTLCPLTSTHSCNIDYLWIMDKLVSLPLTCLNHSSSTISQLPQSQINLFRARLKKQLMDLLSTSVDAVDSLALPLILRLLVRVAHHHQADTQGVGGIGGGGVFDLINCF